MSPVVAQLLPFGWEMQTCRWHYGNEKGLVGLIWMYVLALKGACVNFHTHLQQLQNFLWVNLINLKAFMTHIVLPILRENIPLTWQICSTPRTPTSHTVMEYWRVF